MSLVHISAPVIKKSVAVRLAAHRVSSSYKAVLLGAGGEHLKTFSLTGAASELSLDGFAAGAYTLQVISGNEVVAQQIIIP